MTHRLIIILLLLLPVQSFAGTISFSGTRTGGETSGQTATGKFSDKAGPVEFYIEYGYGKYEDIVVKNEGKFGLDYDREINDRWKFWLDFTTGFNRVAGVTQESFLAAGPKYIIYKGSSRELSLSYGAMFEQAPDHSTNRHSIRPKFKGKYIGAVYYYQPNMADSDDYISKLESTLSLTKWLKLYYTDEYRSILDYRYTETGVRVVFEI